MADSKKCPDDTSVPATAQTDTGMYYGVEDTPPWYLCILLGIQHYLLMVSAPVFFAIIIGRAMCVTNDVVIAELIANQQFMTGVTTFIQVMFGCRLPIIQGPSTAFLAPTFALLNLPQFRCPGPPSGPATDVAACADTLVNASVAMTSLAPTTAADNMTLEGDPADWKLRMNELQGALIAASLLELALGLFGIVGILLRFIGPLFIAPTIVLLGLSMTGAAYQYSSGNWWIALMTAGVITLFSQYMRDVAIPCGKNRMPFPFFRLFSIVLGILVSWLICYIFTITDVIPEGHWGSAARTDGKTQVLHDAAWFRFPYPGQWGTPTFSWPGICVMLAATMVGTVESVGDYYAAARLAGAPPPPVHAVNRGIFVEGICCMLNGLWGTGTGSTSFSSNSGAIGLTKVGCRRMILWTALILVLFGVVTKLGALFATIPDPVVGGVLIMVFGVMTSVGISNLQFVDLNSSRNLFVFGVSVFLGLTVSPWIQQNPGAIKTGAEIFDQVATAMLSTGMLVGGVTAFILDNSIPGTDEERGIKKWRAVVSEVESSKSHNAMSVYDLPFFNDFFTRQKWTRYFPLCPSLDPGCGCKRQRDEEDVAEVKYNGHEDVAVVTEQGRDV